jgi:hypothetical protein
LPTNPHSSESVVPPGGERNCFATPSWRKRFPHRTPLRGYAEKRFRGILAVAKTGSARPRSGHCEADRASPRIASRSDCVQGLQGKVILIYIPAHARAATYMDGIQLKTRNGETTMNFGAIFENVVAQEMSAHGFRPKYYNSAKHGEVDFIVVYEIPAVMFPKHRHLCTNVQSIMIE